MEDTIDSATKIITKWDCYETSDYCPNTSLFNHHSRDDVLEFMNAVKDLQAAIQYLTSVNSSSFDKKLVSCQNLLRMAMKRLGKEFFSLLKANKDNHLHPPPPPTSVDNDSISSSHSTASEDSTDHGVCTNKPPENSETMEISAMDDLKLIADCMMTTGYGKRCLKIYKISRRSIVEGSMTKLGVKKLKKSRVQKMDWDKIELKMKKWLIAVRIGVKQIFSGEKILCDHLFSSCAMPSVRDSCFADVCRDPAIILFRIPGKLAKHSKKSPERLFRYLDLYEAFSELSSDIDKIFSSDLTSAVRSQVKSSMARITDAVRISLSEFESSVQKDSSKSPVTGGGIHPLTRYVMKYFSFLVTYAGALDKILADCPANLQSPLPESYFEGESPPPPAALRFAWLLLVLLCKLDAKSEVYRESSLSYLFLANNLEYIVSKVTNSKLGSVLGEKWVAKHAAKVVQYAANYERMGWGRVISTLPNDLMADIPLDKVKDCFRKFNNEFEEEYRKQVDWVVQDPKLRDDIKEAVATKVGGRYRRMHDKYKAEVAKNRERGKIESVVKFTPDDLENYLSDLLDGPGPDDDDAAEGGEMPPIRPEPAGIQRRRRRLVLLIRQNQ